MIHTRCPSCGGDRLESFFEIRGAPVYSLATVRSKADALAVPRKDLELAFCESCGFIFNSQFDTSLDYFLRGYEDQQGFSRTFMEYLTRTSDELIEKYELRGKAVLEIGCGKGDFVNLLVQRGAGAGIGVDPAYAEGRQADARLTFYKEFFSPVHGALPVDLVCCRHTLEHIHDTQAFLQSIRTAYGSRTDVTIFFEVPQVRRILDGRAFWDIYYEHCSYFSPGSLASLFRRTGFELLDLRLDYGDQYLRAEARPAVVPSTTRLPLEETVDELHTSVARFREKVAGDLAHWRGVLDDLKARGRRTVVWGGGSKAVGFLVNFADLDLVDVVVDVNPHMEGNFVPGIGSRYVQPAFLTEYRPDAVIIMNGIYEREITGTLHAMGLAPEVYAL
jgi:SAM-dependent methyltransferase